jgi:hypothetical protein
MKGAQRPWFTRLGIVAPLRHRGFRLLWAGLVVSLAGDGIFLIAVAWEAYTLSNHASALAGVGLAASLPQVALLLLGGAISDRMPKRHVLIAADAVRAVTVGLLAVTGWLGAIRLWELWATAGVIGAATAFAAPAFDAIVPELVPQDALQHANGLDQVLRPTTLRLLGPALGGILIAVGGSPGALAADAATFAFSAWCVWRIPATPVRAPGAASGQTLVDDLREGLRYIRGEVWLWGTFVAASFTYLLFVGPSEVLIPYVVKNVLHGSATTLGLVLGLGGAGSLLAAAVVGQRRHVHRPVTFMYATWTAATLLIAGYGLATTQWQLAGIALAVGALEAAGTVVWATLKQRLVPGPLLGRVSSLDWFVSTALMPLSFAITPAAVSLLGVRATFVGAGSLGAVITGCFLFLPGMRSHDRPQRARDLTLRVGD